ncbi:MAG: TolC family protein [Mucinivorans sp.]
MKNIIIILLAMSPIEALAQFRQPISYIDYMVKVQSENLAYAAQKLEIPIAQANLRAAKVFNDPTLSVEYAYNDDHRMQMGQGLSAGLSKTFSPGKRTARIGLASSEKEMAMALLDDFFNNLRAQATRAYFEAAKQERLYELQLSSYNSINELAKADSMKFVLGKITKTDAMQSRLEAGILYNELLKAQSNMQGAYVALNVHLGSFRADTLYVPTEEAIEVGQRDFNYKELLLIALENRADLVAAMKNVDVANKALKLVRQERNIDLDVSLGYNYNSEVRNELAPAPKFSGMTLGVGIPLKFSNANKGAIQAASYKAVQAEKQYQQAQIEVQTELSQNYNAYRSCCLQVELFNKSMLDKAKAVMEGKRYSYGRGESSLLELLNAQQTYNQVQAVYIETLFGRTLSLIDLERSAGIWDIE